VVRIWDRRRIINENLKRAAFRSPRLPVRNNRVEFLMSSIRSYVLAAAAALSLAMLPALVPGFVQAQEQNNVAPRAAAAPAKPLKFEVVSIHPDKNGDNFRLCPQHIGAATPDGYRMGCLWMIIPILQAYPSPNGPASIDASQEIPQGFPSWVATEHYDIDARVAPEDLKDWQNPALRPAMMRAMLRSMLADRLKLVVHRGSETEPVYLLEVAKGGPRFKATVPGEKEASSRFHLELPGGGENVLVVQNGETITHDYGITMAQLARNFPNHGGRAVVDDTGLKGRYDITYEEPKPEVPASNGAPHPPAPDVTRSASSIAHSLGLKLVAAKRAIPTLVCDHIERPTPN
jgi:bla regulator protein BlaR1